MYPPGFRTNRFVSKPAGLMHAHEAPGIGIIANIMRLTPSVIAIEGATGNMKAAGTLRARQQAGAAAKIGFIVLEFARREWLSQAPANSYKFRLACEMVTEQREQHQKALKQKGSR